MANEDIVSVVTHPQRKSTIIHDLIDDRKRTMLMVEADNILRRLPERRLEKKPLDELEGKVLRDAQAIGALHPNLPLTQVEVEYGGRVRTEFFAGRNHEGDAWIPFQSPNITVAKFNPPDARRIAASKAAARGWWQP